MCDSKRHGPACHAGVLRIAHIPTDDLLAMLDAHHATYPVSAELSTSFSADGSSGSYSFQFATASMAPGGSSGPGSGQLLMLALDHHLDAGLQADQILQPMYTCIKGRLTGVLGTRWTLTEPLANISYFLPNLGNINATEAEAIRRCGWAAIGPLHGPPVISGQALKLAAAWPAGP